jgi:hypothetical protein
MENEFLVIREKSTMNILGRVLSVIENKKGKTYYTRWMNGFRFYMNQNEIEKSKYELARCKRSW